MPDGAHEPAWSVAEAKARLSELLNLAIKDGPQAITRHGEEVAVVVSIEAWRRRSARTGTLAEFLAASPLRGSELEIGSVEVSARDVVL